MTASLETLVVAAYVFADALSIPRPGPAGAITDPELVALAVAQASMGESSDRKFLGMIGYRLEGWFPHLPDQSQYNRRLRRLTPQIAAVQLAVAELVAEAASGRGNGDARAPCPRLGRNGGRLGPRRISEDLPRRELDDRARLRCYRGIARPLV